MSNPIPGWYADPSTPGQQRYWDGTQWTENTAPLPQAAPPTPPPGYAPTPPPGYAPTPPPYAAYGMPSYGAAQSGATYAHWGQRVGATLLDGIFAVPFYIVAVIALVSGSTTTTDVYGNSVTTESAAGGAVAAIAYIAMIGFIIWNQSFRQGRTGYSLGKQVVGIKLINESTAEPIGGWLSFGRQVLHIVDEIPFFLGLLWPLWDEKKQTFADKIVGSVVIVAPKPKS